MQLVFSPGPARLLPLPPPQQLSAAFFFNKWPRESWLLANLLMLAQSSQQEYTVTRSKTKPQCSFAAAAAVAVVV